MGLNNAPNVKANGTIAPSVFVKQDTSGDHLVLQAGAGDATVGISQVGMKRAPGLSGSDPTVAANAGDVLMIYSVGDFCMLTFGGTVTRGDYLKSDANGKGITASSGDVVGAVCWESGVSGGTGLVQILGKGSKMP